MSGTITDIVKSRGRPRVDATPIGLRLPPDQLRRLDGWIAGQPDPKPSRPEAIRRLIARSLQAGEAVPIGEGMAGVDQSRGG